jgi:hypothetical protein
MRVAKERNNTLKEKEQSRLNKTKGRGDHKELN